MDERRTARSSARAALQFAENDAVNEQAGVRGTRSARGERSARSARSARNAEGRSRSSRRAAVAAEPEQTKSRNVPALDGIRCLAVLGVIFYHMHFQFAQGGLLGVTVFFVLSGYLITNLLLIELDNTSTLNLLNFWFRRLRRLLPAILFALAGTAVLCTIFDHALLTKMRTDLLPSLFFFNNWWQIFHEVSYFDALGSPSPITHYWSLAIEEQFYLLWPPILLLLTKFGVDRTYLRRGILGAALLSILLMAIMFSPDQDPSRVYYGTDTRAFSLLLGAALAFFRPTRANDDLTEGCYALPQPTLEALGFAALAALIVMMGFCNGFAPFIYRGGLALCSVLTAVVIYVSVHPGTVFTRVLGWPGFVFVGKLSYSMYLWHFPVLLIMNPVGSTAPAWYMAILELIVITGLSWFSFQFVEDPIRHGAIGRVLSEVREGQYSLQEWFMAHRIYAGSLALVVLIAVGGLLFVPDTVAMNNADALKEQSEENARRRAEMEKAAEEKAYDLVMIGDSVMATAQVYETDSFPNQLIDAEVSRQLDAGAEVFKSYLDDGYVGDVVVFSLGTNGPLTSDSLEDLVAQCGKRHVFFVNCYGPYDYVESNNELLSEVASKHDNVEVIGWYEASLDHGEYFDGDGTHPGPEGAAVFMGLIHDAVDKYMPDDAYEVKKEDDSSDDSAEEGEDSDANAEDDGDDAEQGDDESSSSEGEN